MNYKELTEQELLGLLIGEKKEEFVADHLMASFDSLPDLLLHAAEEELLQVKGIGPSRVKQLLAVSELIKRLNRASKPLKAIKSPYDVQEACKDMRYLKKEHFRIILLNTKNHIIAMDDVSVGTLNASLVHPREVFSLAVKKVAASVILVHNHPSGDPAPSQEDLQITKRLVDAGNIIGIKVIDHIVIGDSVFYSFNEHGNL